MNGPLSDAEGPGGIAPRPATPAQGPSHVRAPSPAVLSIPGLDRLLARVGFGAEQLGGHAWGAVDPVECARAVREAVDCGITLFDTADCYGLGESERRLGTALSDVRGQIVVATKFGVRFDAAGRVFYDNSPVWIREAVRGSLSRLGLERIDLYQLHHRDRHTPLADALGTLEDLRREGLIATWGVSNVALRELRAAAARSPATFSLEFSLADRAREAEIRAGALSGFVCLTYGTLGQGVLTGKYGGRADLAPGDRRHLAALPNFHARLARNLRIVEVLRQVAAAQPGRSVPAVAIRWVVETLPCVVALVGVKSRAQLQDLVRALREPLDSIERAALDAVSAAPQPGE